MKQRDRKRILDDLLSKLENRDFDFREFALFQLALVLDRSNLRAGAAELPEYYTDNLSRDLLRLRLSQNEQAGVAARLAQLIESHGESRSSAVWTLGKLSKETGFPVLLGLDQSIRERLDNETAIQVCDAVRNWCEPKDALVDFKLDQDALHLLLGMLRQWRERDNIHLRRSSTAVFDLIKAQSDGSPGGTY